ncbi:MAG: hypothetical protein DHS20C11_09590 [Lysobacteraceae bacterium]|nr:MAG: hypothetical protein DHS20C11_09590 [Xanthomonadaceae bacterium]
MQVTEQQVAAGQAVYTPRTLAIYDFVVLGVSNRLIWRCPTPQLLAHYERLLSANHLDVGVGSGFFLDRCRFPSPTPRLVLMDLNSSALSHAATRVGRYAPQTVVHNVLEPAPKDLAKFDSIAINYLLHCIPGTMSSKASVFGHLKALLKPGGVLFGSTLLGTGIDRSWAARRLMKVYNKRGIFCNEQDDLDSLREGLADHFDEPHFELAGCGALFSARA